MAEILSTISLVTFIIAIVCLALAVFLGFKFKIRNVVGDLSGKNARKSIEKIRESNEKTGAKFYRASTENIKRGKLTGTMPDSDKLNKENKKKKVSEDVGRDKEVAHDITSETLKEQMTELLDETEILSDSQETGLLDSTNETELLNDANETEVLEEVQETSLLDDNNETSLLDEESEATTEKSKLVLIEEVMLIHTEEVI